MDLALAFALWVSIGNSRRPGALFTLVVMAAVESDVPIPDVDDADGSRSREAPRLGLLLLPPPV